MELTLKQMAINQMRLDMPLDVKQKYKAMILEACKLNKSHIEIEVSNNDYANTVQWLELEGLTVVTPYDPNRTTVDTTIKLNVSWA